MPREVINLLSSSPDRVLPKPTSPPPRHSSATRAPIASKAGNVFDLTTSDCFDDSPAPKEPSPRNSQTSSPPLKRAHDGRAPPTRIESQNADAIIIPDSSQEQNDTQRVASNGTKRIRLSLSPLSDRGAAPAVKSNGLFPCQQGLGGHDKSDHLRRKLIRDDPIEFSSSPELSLKRPIAGARPTRTKNADEGISAPQGDVPSNARKTQRITGVFEDPFASSSPPKPPPPKKIAPKSNTNEDPFASSQGNVVKEPLTTTRSKPSGGTASTLTSNNPSAWDPISSSAPDLGRSNGLFVDSSPPRPRRNNGKQPATVIDLSDSESISDNVVELDSDENSGGSFPELDDMDIMAEKRIPISTSNKTTTRPFLRTVSDNITRTISRPKPRNPTTKKSTEERLRDKEDREREKERKKKEKQDAKEQRAREKERAAALAEVNKVRTDKKVSAPEMIVSLPSTLPSALMLQAQTLLDDLQIEHTTWQSPLGYVVTWRRKVKSAYNDELGIWEPIPLRIDDESFALVIVTADDFVNMALESEDEGEGGFDPHVSKMKSSYPTHQLLYMIEGLNPWLRKNRNLRNRQFVSAVRAQAQAQEQGSAPTASQSSSRRRRNNPARGGDKEYVDEDTIEDALLHLQVLHGLFVHHTNTPVETAQWIAVFTQHISTVPYRKQREAANAAGAAFCMESGQVRTGEDTKDTYTKMLQEIVRVTAPIAYGIAAEFPTVTRLVAGLEEGGPLTLEGCRKSANRDGAVTDRTVGPAVSRRVYKVFTGRDEKSTDV